MCIARVGKVVSLSGGRAEVEFFDGRSLAGVDLSMVGGEKGAFVEVYGNLALSILTPSEAKKRKAAWTEVRRAAALPMRAH